MVRVKVCGIRTMADAMAAVDAGADAIGFIFAPSPRKIMAEDAREISLALPPFVSRVGVFVNQQHFEVQEMASFCDLDVVQLHGDEPPEYCKKFSQRVIKAFQVRDESYLEQLPLYREVVDAFLLDTYHCLKRGGTGEAFDWQLALAAKEYGPIILAGGLNQTNVVRAVTAVQPYGIDVSSGVEDNGQKSRLKITEFFHELRRS